MPDSTYQVGDTYTICNDSDPYIRPVSDDPQLYAQGRWVSQEEE